MKLILHISFLLTLSLGSLSGEAQTLSLLGGDSTGVALFGDARILVLTKKHAPARPSAAIYASRGFRVQIYSGTDRTKAVQVKVDFMKRFPGVRTYMSFIQPQFRVKVGDYKNREDAAEMYRQLTSLYAPVMIVPDIVEINTAHNDQ